jgi:hypothetical protein
MKHLKFVVPTSQANYYIELLAPSGQGPEKKLYRSGFEHYLARMPVLTSTDKDGAKKSKIIKSVMHELALDLRQNISKLNLPSLRKDTITRITIGMEEPQIGKDGIKTGAQILVLFSPKNTYNPPHGHAEGYLHDELISGSMLVNHFSKPIFKRKRVVIPQLSEIYEGENIISSCWEPMVKGKQPYSVAIHNFKAIDDTFSVHYIPFFPTDGLTNSYEVKRFEDVIGYDKSDFTQISGRQGLYSALGDVLLVRSTNVPYLGDHYITITGGLVKKSYGIRPMHNTILAGPNTLLKEYDQDEPLVLLLMSESLKKEFNKFHFSQNN